MTNYNISSNNKSHCLLINTVPLRNILSSITILTIYINFTFELNNNNNNIMYTVKMFLNPSQHN